MWHSGWAPRVDLDAAAAADGSAALSLIATVGSARALRALGRLDDQLTRSGSATGGVTGFRRAYALTAAASRM